MVISHQSHLPSHHTKTNIYLHTNTPQNTNTEILMNQSIIKSFETKLAFRTIILHNLCSFLFCNFNFWITFCANCSLYLFKINLLRLTCADHELPQAITYLFLFSLPIFEQFVHIKMQDCRKKTSEIEWKTHWQYKNQPLIMNIIILGVAHGTCVLESDFGFILNCNFKKSSLLRVRNLGGVKAHFGLGKNKKHHTHIQ